MAQTRMNLESLGHLAPGHWLALWREAWVRLLPWGAWRRSMPLTRLPLLGAGTRTALVRGAHWLQTLEEAQPPPGRRTRPHALLLPPGQVLWRRLRLPASTPPGALQAAAGLEVQAMSPFAAEETLWAWADSATADAAWRQVDICITARRLVQQALERSLPAGRDVPPPPVEVWASAPDGTPPVLLPGFGERPRLRREARQRWGLAGGALLLMTLLAALLLTPSLQLRQRARDAVQQFEQLGQDSRAAMAQRQALMEESEIIAALLERQARQINPVQLMVVLTDLLPDHTALQMLQLHENTLTIQGLSDNASEIVNLLDRHPGFRNVNLPSAVTRDPRSNKDRFTLQAVVEPAVFGRQHGGERP